MGTMVTRTRLKDTLYVYYPSWCMLSLVVYKVSTRLQMAKKRQSFFTSLPQHEYAYCIITFAYSYILLLYSKWARSVCTV